MPLSMPEDLAARMGEGEVVLFVGAGMSQPALPGWSKLLTHMLGWACRQQISLEGMEDSIRDLIRRDKLPLAAQQLRSRMGENNFCRFLREVFRDPKL